MATFSAITEGIEVQVEPIFLEDQSSPEENYFVWAYKVQIENRGDRRVQLRNRYWHITDGRGQVQEVSGVGVVGEQPVLEPGDQFEYTSGTPLSTPSGIMMGVYQMEDSDGHMLEIAVPAFSLDSPHQERSLN